MTEQAQHGAASTRRVIGSVRRDPGRSMVEPAAWVGHTPWVEAEPRPMPQDVVARAAFPSGRRFETYTDLAADPVYGRRMREHAVRHFAGELGAEYPFRPAATTQ
ncbi:hypothetical protein [Nocardia sp. CY41]|uniref:hypothetical protein n=1 Tax=Nocardia sp. CY41 TaxID=2608686 RepID=UPI00135CC8D7|nr:hypothetical protein [Nocardia sp. CY41]